MGKIRVHTIGDESVEKKQKEKAQKRKEAKEVLKKETDGSEGTKETTEIKDKKEKTKEKKQVKQKSHQESSYKASKRHLANATVVDNKKIYPLEEAIDLLLGMKRAKFDETVEMHFNTTENGISGNITLPHGSGKVTKVVVLNPSVDQKGADDIIKKIEGGVIDFDILIATPDAMPKLAKVARILGPRGLMPNPKTGTITKDPEKVALNYAKGQMNFKTEAKNPIMHLSVGKVSFGKDKLAENIQAAIAAVQIKNIKTATLKSTMSTGIKVII